MLVFEISKNNTNKIKKTIAKSLEIGFTLYSLCLHKLKICRSYFTLIFHYTPLVVIHYYFITKYLFKVIVDTLDTWCKAGLCPGEDISPSNGIIDRLAYSLEKPVDLPALIWEVGEN